MTSLLVLTEGSAVVGLGHIRRCLTLAKALRQSVEATFAVSGGASAEKVVADAGFVVTPIHDLADAHEVGRAVERSGADLVVIDSYRATEDVFRACGKALTVVLDDLADRRLPVDVVVNPALAATRLSYRGLTDGLLLLGCDYALLRPEFATRVVRTIRQPVERVLVTLGGGEHGSLPNDVAHWCLEAIPAATIEIVAGPFSRERARTMFDEHVVVLDNPDMREAMLRADIAVTAGGQTLFELAATGLPSIVMETAANQSRNAADFAAAGTIVRAGATTDADLRAGFAAALAAVAAPDVRRVMSAQGLELVDGRGADRTVAAIVKLLPQ